MEGIPKSGKRHVRWMTTELAWSGRHYHSHSAPFFAVLTQFWQRLLKRGENERYTDHYICSNRLFPWSVFLNHNFHKLRGPHFWPFGVSRRDSAFPPDERPMIIPPRPAKVWGL